VEGSAEEGENGEEVQEKVYWIACILLLFADDKLKYVCMADKNDMIATLFCPMRALEMVQGHTRALRKFSRKGIHNSAYYKVRIHPNQQKSSIYSIINEIFSASSGGSERHLP